jgi:hypothetical protein
MGVENHPKVIELCNQAIDITQRCTVFPPQTAAILVTLATSLHHSATTREPSHAYKKPQDLRTVRHRSSHRDPTSTPGLTSVNIHVPQTAAFLDADDGLGQLRGLATPSPTM